MNKKFIEDNINLMHYISSKVGASLSDEDRQDLVHDVCIKLLESKEEADQSHASAYINRIMRNTVINFIRDGRVDAMGHSESIDKPAYDEDGGHCTACDQTPDPDSEVDYEEREATKHVSIKYRHNIDNLCRYLTKSRAKLFRMRYYLGMLPQEIAQWTGMTNNAVRRGLTRAVKDAQGLTSTIPAVGGRYDGLSLREMALSELPDRILYPFKLRYINEKNLMTISALTNRSISEIKNDISRGEKMIYARYKLDVRGR